MTFSHMPQTLSTILRCCSLCLGFLTLTPGKSWAGRVSRRYLPFLYSRKAVSNRFWKIKQGTRISFSDHKDE